MYYALQPEPEARRRFAVLTASAIAGGALQIAAFVFAAGIETKAPSVPRRIQVTMVAAKPVQPKQPPAPMVEAKPPTVPKVPRPQTTRVRTSRQPAPMPPAAETPPVESPSPVPLIVGLTLSSTQSAGRGPRFAVGNTTMGAPRPVAATPKAHAVPRGPARRSGASATASNQASRPTGKVIAAKMKRGASPRYTKQAKNAAVEGVVVLSITVGPGGAVESAAVLRGLGYGLDDAALQAAKATRWHPATLGGRPVRSTRRFSVRFTLEA